MTICVGVDAGNYETKVFSALGPTKLLSALGEYRERNIVQSFSDDDIEYEFQGNRGFAGTLAKYESEFTASRMGTTKAHTDTLIRVLLSLSKHSQDSNFNLVVGQPISGHTPSEKSLLKSMLVGPHTITINGRTRQITIERAEVAAEGGVAFWAQPRHGIVRILDFGSGTVNGASLDEARYVDRDSFTLPYGMSTVRSTDVSAFVRLVCIEALKRWQSDDFVYVVGGAAELLQPAVNEFFAGSKLLKPTVNTKGSILLLDPAYANAVGLYQVSKKVFANASNDCEGGSV